MSDSTGLTIGTKYKFIFHSGREFIGKLQSFSEKTFEINLGHKSENLILYKEDLAEIKTTEIKRKVF